MWAELKGFYKNNYNLKSVDFELKGDYPGYAWLDNVIP